MQIKDLLNCIGPIIGRNHLTGWNLLAYLVLHLLAETEVSLDIKLWVQIVFHRHYLLQGPYPEITGLSELGMVLMLRIQDAFVSQEWTFLFYIDFVRLRQVRVWPLPSLHHDFWVVLRSWDLGGVVPHRGRKQLVWIVTAIGGCRSCTLGWGTRFAALNHLGIDQGWLLLTKFKLRNQRRTVASFEAASNTLVLKFVSDIIERDFFTLLIWICELQNLLEVSTGDADGQNVVVDSEYPIDLVIVLACDCELVVHLGEMSEDFNLFSNKLLSIAIFCLIIIISIIFYLLICLFLIFKINDERNQNCVLSFWLQLLLEY